MTELIHPILVIKWLYKWLCNLHKNITTSVVSRDFLDGESDKTVLVFGTIVCVFDSCHVTNTRNIYICLDKLSSTEKSINGNPTY